ncbi:hypothetical protein ACTFIR_009447 [Dictyostelium discoideum]
MSTTVNNNDASSSTFTRFMKEHMFSSNTDSRSQRTHDDSDTENEQSDKETSNNIDVPTYYQLSNTLHGGVQIYVNVAPFGTPEGITVSSTVKNNDTDLLIVEKRINDSLKPLLLMSVCYHLIALMST